MLLGIGCSRLIGAVAPLLLFPEFVRPPPLPDCTGAVVAEVVCRERDGDCRACLVASTKTFGEQSVCEDDDDEEEGGVTKGGGVVVGVDEVDEAVEEEVEVDRVAVDAVLLL